MNREFINKMIEAKKLEGEAFKLLIPENMRGHVSVIENEMKAILTECITDCAFGMKSTEKDSKQTKSKVQKVEID